MTTLSAHDQRYLQQTIALSLEARRQGRHPFAALVVAADGRILAQAINDSMPPGNPTRHAELVAAAEASRVADAATLAGATLYSSAEPCAMCAGAVYWCGIGRVVYALSETRLLALTGKHPENPTLSLPCRRVLACGQRDTQVLGPVLEDEAASVHDGFWQG